MPHPAHFICSRDCRFHLATRVGPWIVSTVGEFEPCMSVQEIRAESKGLTLKGRGDARRADAMRQLGYEEIGYQRTYETMVFPSAPRDDDGDTCCPWTAADFCEVECEGYNDAGAAYAGHLALCEKYAAEVPGGE